MNLREQKRKKKKGPGSKEIWGKKHHRSEGRVKKMLGDWSKVPLLKRG